MTSKPAVKTARIPASQQQPPWYTEAQTARKTALDEARPCVLILNADHSAL
jgi:hypothetical protein